MSMVTIMRAGGCCVNLSPYHPKDRLQRIITACDSTIVLTTPQHTPLFQSIPDDTAVTKAFVEDLPAADHNNFPIVSPDDTAYILFTSGSIGGKHSMLSIPPVFIDSQIIFRTERNCD
jgi:non-ribosomal peptide synthetase component F